MERQAEELFAHLDELGSGSMLEGVIRGIEENWFQGRIADSAYELERKLNQGERIVIGVNRFTEGNEENGIELLQITNADEARHSSGSIRCATIGTPAPSPRRSTASPPTRPIRR